MLTRQDVLIRDTIHNCDPVLIGDNFDRVTYAKGIMLAVVSMIMAFKDCDFITAVEHLSMVIGSTEIDRRAIPDAWVEHFKRKDINVI